MVRTREEVLNAICELPCGVTLLRGDNCAPFFRRSGGDLVKPFEMAGHSGARLIVKELIRLEGRARIGAAGVPRDPASIETMLNARKQIEQEMIALSEKRLGLRR